MFKNITAFLILLMLSGSFSVVAQTVVSNVEILSLKIGDTYFPNNTTETNETNIVKHSFGQTNGTNTLPTFLRIKSNVDAVVNITSRGFFVYDPNGTNEAVPFYASQTIMAGQEVDVKIGDHNYFKGIQQQTT